MKPELVIALYRPRKGKDAELRKLIAKHLPVLRKLELVTDRVPIVMKAKDGTYIEIFEWRTADSADLAHQLPEVAKVWEAMGKIADFPKIAELKEIHEHFPHFKPVKF